MPNYLPVCALLLVGSVAAQTQIPIPAFGRTFASTLTRGFYFQTPVPIVVTGLRVPDEANAGIQCVELSVLAAPPPAYSATVLPTQLFYNNNTPAGQIIPCSVLYNAGDYVCVLGACGTTTMNNSYGTPVGPYASNIFGNPVTLTRLLTQTNLSTTGGHQLVSSEAAFEVSRVEVYYTTPTGYAQFTPYGVGCGGSGPPGIYEQFTTANDLSNTGITLFPTGNTYVAVQGATPIVTPSGAPRAFTDDQTQAIALPGTFTHATGSTTTLWVCSNGWISFESTTLNQLGESVPLMQSGPARIYGWWDDLNPGVGGTMHCEQDPVATNLFHVTWTNVPEFSIGGSNTFQISLDMSSGTMEIKWGALTALDGLVGYHPGNNAGVPAMTDISAMTAKVLGDGVQPIQLSNVAGSRPVLGSTLNMEVRNVRAGTAFGVGVIGFTKYFPGIDLSPVGLEGCLLYTTLDLTTFLFPSGTPVPWSVPVPSDPTLAGAQAHAQAAMFTSGYTSSGIIASNGVDLLLNPL
jgi:hypothetical protein